MDWQQTAVEFVLPVAGAALAGALIGVEREYRGRPAGLRTHILVCLASALLMLAAVHQVRWLSDTPDAVIRIDPVRMAHGILTGIGFLCGGVIFREGFSVHGLTTAASLWMTSALGTLFGVGFYGLAIGGTAATLVILAAFRWVDGRVPQISIVDVAVRYRRGDAFPEAEFRALVKELGLRPSGISHKLMAGGEVVQLATTLRGQRGFQPELLSSRLCADPRVFEFDVESRND
jgi:putative Mg2+ transporter-C (MgtC) family protein